MRLIADAPQIGRKRDRTRFVCGQSDNDHLIGRRRENLTTVSNAAGRVRGRGNCRSKVEGAAVVGRILAVAEEKMKIGEALIFLLFDRLAH